MPAGVASTGAGCGGAGCDGVVGAGAGFGVRFFDFALLADFAIFFIPFFFRAGAPRFAFLDFFATFIIPIKTMPRRQAIYFYRTNRLTNIAMIDCPQDRGVDRRSPTPRQLISTWVSVLSDVCQPRFQAITERRPNS